MIIRTMGFNLQGNEHADLDNFFSNLATNTYRNPSTIVSVIQRNGYWIGVLLSIRDQRSFCKMLEAGENFTITLQELQANESPVEFNVFLINKQTMRGIYLHYYHSKSLTSALTLLRSLYDDFKRNLMNREITNIENSEEKRKVIDEQKKAIRAKFKQSLTYSIWVKPQSFIEMVRLLDSIKTLEVEVESLTIDEAMFRPLADYSRSVKQKFNFETTPSTASNLRNLVTTAINSLGDSLLNAKVSGVDPSGLEVIYSLANNVDYLSSYDYDEIVAGLEIKSNDIETSLLNSRLITQIEAVAQSPVVRTMLTTPQSNGN